jgi:amidohydrolase
MPWDNTPPEASMTISDTVRSLHDEVTQWRHRIHAHPETAFQERVTSDFVASKLEEFGIEVARGLGGTGVVGTLRRGKRSLAVGLRADMDALFINEENTFDYHSTIKGKMHACGHDGHTAMLLGAARHLAERGNFDGTIRFVFQPAEETGDEHCGGNAMVRDGLFEKFPVASVFDPSEHATDHGSGGLCFHVAQGAWVLCVSGQWDGLGVGAVFPS